MERQLILLDTHVFVWWAASQARISKPARRALERASARLLSDISLWEIAKLVSLGRLRFDRGVETWLGQALVDTEIEVVPIDPTIASRSTNIAPNFHGDPADQLIAATAIERGAVLLTADENLRASPALRTMW